MSPSSPALGGASCGAVWHGRAMASRITLRLADVQGRPAAAVEGALAAAAGVFAEVERQCTRFDPDSPLMRLNARAGEWRRAAPVLYGALAAACRAWRATGGRFDPRVLDALVGWGYDRTLPFGRGGIDLPAAAGPVRAAPAGPFLDRSPRRACVRVVGAPLDLGGIAKGLAVRWAASRLRPVSRNFLVDAGGDCCCRGCGPDGDGWRLGVEDPAGGAEPVAVVEVRDAAVCTSSRRRRAWRAGGRPVHHLIDPRTGAPAGAGLRSVTVVAPDPAWAEVWTKALFVEGVAGIAGLAADRRVAAFWVDAGGGVGWSPRMRRHLLWVGEPAAGAHERGSGSGGVS